MKRIFICITAAVLFGLSTPAHGTVTGQWDFNSSNLVATVGTELAYRGDTETYTTFTTATIGGSEAIVMGFPAATVDQGYIMTHGIAPNGGGSYVNQYTVIMDIMFPSASSGVFRALWQTSQGNGNDADLFVNTGNGIGISGAYEGAILPDTWHRVAFVFDLTLSTDRLKKFIDGTLVGTQTLADGVDGRWSLDPTALLFTDEDGETAAGFVNSIQIHDQALSPVEISALGVPSAAGIPIPVVTNVSVAVTPTNQVSVVAGMAATPFTAWAAGPGTLSYQWYRNGEAIPEQTSSLLVLTNVQSANAGDYTVVVNNGTQFATSSPPAVVTVEAAGPTFVTGQWDFNQGDLRATVGQPLQYFDATVQADTSFGLTTSFVGVTDIAGQPANVMFCNPSAVGITNWGGLVMTHGMAPNGGGTNVNQYTVILDLFYINWTSGFYRALWQTTPQNTNDADAFINRENGLGISQQYDGELILDNWHRIVLAYDLTRREFGKYIDGTNVLAAPTGDSPRGPHHVHYLDNDPDVTDGGFTDMRWSLGPTALVLADGQEDGEVQPVYVSSIQVRSGRMTDAAIAALGAPTANKIPQAPASIQARRSGSSVVIDWSGAVLERATSVTGQWSEVTGAAHPHVITSPTGIEFFRVK